MSNHQTRTPELLPLLSRGKHRSPRKGGCFMELASFLAGERWSDHPACTHPLLAAVARHVNDLTSDAARPRLARLIPPVIGLTSNDPRVDVRIALRCATTALPVAAAERQQILAVSVIACERILTSLDRRPEGGLEPQSRAALASAPLAARWASRFADEMRMTIPGFRKYGAPSTVRNAVQGIAQACVPDPDDLLYDLLAQVIDDCTALIRRATDPSGMPDPARWEAACRLTGVAAGL